MGKAYQRGVALVQRLSAPSYTQTYQWDFRDVRWLSVLRGSFKMKSAEIHVTCYLNHGKKLAT